MADDIGILEPDNRYAFHALQHVQRFDERTLMVLGSDGLHWLSSDGTLEKHAHRASSELDAALPSGGITHFLCAADGSLWLGTSLGLMRVRDGVVTQYLERAGFHGDAVFAILDDGRGHFWISSNRGIARLAKADLEALDQGTVEEIAPRWLGFVAPLCAMLLDSAVANKHPLSLSLEIDARFTRVGATRTRCADA